MSRRVLVLSYHNIMPDGGHQVGDRANHLALGAFVRQLYELRRTHDVVSLTEARAGVKAPEPIILDARP